MAEPIHVPLGTIHAAADSHTFRTTEKMFYKILDICEQMCYNIIKGNICS